MLTAEQLARANIDALLTAAGWAVRDVSATNIHAARGVAIREFPLESGHGFADYLTGYHSQPAAERSLKARHRADERRANVY